MGERRAGCSGRRGWNDTACLSLACNKPDDKFLNFEHTLIIFYFTNRSAFFFSNWQITAGCSRPNVASLAFLHLIPSAYKSPYFPAVVAIKTASSRDAPKQLIKLFRFLTVFGAVCVETGEKLSGFNKSWRPNTAIEAELTIILWEPNGLRAAVLVPDECAGILDAPFFENAECHR